MLVYIAVVATFNLCLGYLLGAYFGVLPELPVLRLPARRQQQPETPLVQPAGTGPQQAARPAASPAAAPEPEPGSLSDEELLAGLAAFQEQLAQMGQELCDSQDDSEAFGVCAKNIQEANHAYLESTQEQITQLPEKHKLRETAVAGAEKVGKISDEFDAIVGNGLGDNASRARLVEKSSELNDKLVEVRQSHEEQARAATANAAGAAGLATLDCLLQQIDWVLQEDGEPNFRTAVLLRRDPSEAEQDPQAPAGLAAQLQTKVAEMLSAALPKADHAACWKEDEFLVLLDEGDLDAMTERVDQLRQRLAETTFLSGGLEVKTTLTCAIADMPGAKSREEVISRLEEAMAESNRFGVNRTFHHDGKFPTPVPPAEAEIEPQTVTL